MSIEDKLELLTCLAEGIYVKLLCNEYSASSSTICDLKKHIHTNKSSLNCQGITEDIWSDNDAMYNLKFFQSGSRRR